MINKNNIYKFGNNMYIRILQQNKYSREIEVRDGVFDFNKIKPSNAIYNINVRFDDDCTSWYDNFMSENDFNQKVFDGRRLFYTEQDYEYITIILSNKEEFEIRKELEFYKSELDNLTELYIDFIDGGLSKEEFEKIFSIYKNYWETENRVKFLNDKNTNK